MKDQQHRTTGPDDPSASASDPDTALTDPALTDPALTESAPTVAAGSWLAVKDAAAVARVHVDTIKRRLRAGAFPNARRQTHLGNAPWEIPVADLVAAGLVAAEQVEAAVDLGLARRRHEETEQLRLEVAGLTAERDALRQQLAAAQSEIDFLRSTVTTALRAAS